MNRFEKRLIWAGVALIFLWFFAPPLVHAERSKRDNVAAGVKVIRTAFFKVQRYGNKATLWARPQFQRGYRIVLDGNRRDELLLGLDIFKTPVPVSVTVGSRFVFQYRHSACSFRVTGIDAKGVEIEVGTDAKSWFFRNQSVLLPWK